MSCACQEEVPSATSMSGWQHAHYDVRLPYEYLFIGSFPPVPSALGPAILTPGTMIESQYLIPMLAILNKGHYEYIPVA
jgi:hypothetical protein